MLQTPIFAANNITRKFSKAPDICAITLGDNESKMNKPLKFDVSTGTEKITYELDSIVIRDNGREHFSCVLTCNKKEKAFDGASVGRLKDLDWKSKINKDIEWSYEYKGQYDHYDDMRFNFTKGTLIMFYYRIN